MTNTVVGARLAGIAAAAPERTVTPEETATRAGIGSEQATKIAGMTGVRKRHVGPEGMCTSDLAFAAADRLLTDLAWERASVGALIFVSQSPDYALPATACLLQKRLGLSKGCAAFDVGLGCSGYAYGLWLGATLCASLAVKRALLLCGDTSSVFCAPADTATAFLFGDAGAATAIEQDPSAPPITFVLGTDGEGGEFLIVPRSAFRDRITAEGLERRPGTDGTLRHGLDLYMDGAEVFAFTIRQVPRLMADLLESAGWRQEEVEAFVPHQANRFMLEHLCKRMKFPLERMILSLEEFGNTSSASIPLSICYRLRSKLTQGSMRLALAGFGVGWSWGAAALDCGPLVVSEIQYLKAPGSGAECKSNL